MKKYFFLVIPMAILISSCSSQSIPAHKVPSVVLNAFKAQYPGSNDVEWEKHGNTYEAEFDVTDTSEIVARIDESGNVVMKKEDLSVNQLEPTILTTIQSRYKDYRLDDVEKIQKGNSVFYQVELKAKGKKELNVVLAADGTEDKNLPYWH